MIKELAVKALDFKTKLNLDDETALALTYLIFHTWLEASNEITMKEVHAGNQLADLEVVLGSLEDSDLFFLKDWIRPSKIETTFFDQLLGFYDYEMRKKLGVWYTPKEVVGYMVRSVDELLRAEFGVELESEEVGVLDPSTGTGGFLSEVLAQGKREGLYGMELMKSSYMIASTLLSKGGVNLIYGNTLNQLSFKMKERYPVVLGNPPYNKKSGNNETDIVGLMGAYACEGSSGALNDDYLKFIRYAQHIVEKEEEGIVAYITNNSFLSSVMMKNMRKSLLGCFDEIYIVDFDDDPTTNIFKIKQPVCMVFFVKSGGVGSKVFYTKIEGSLEEKLAYCSKGSWGKENFKEVDLVSESKFFYPQDKSLRQEYESNSFSLDDVFRIKGCGIRTACDSLLLDPRKEELEKKIQAQLEVGSKGRGGSILDMPFTPFNKMKYYESTLTSTRCLTLLKQLKAEDQIYLNFTSSNRDKTPYSHVLMTKGVIRNNFFMGVHNELIAPLYEYHEGDMFTSEHQTSNFKPDFMVSKKGLDVLDYIYGRLHDTSYRAKYNDLLKEEIPRVPYASSEDEFEEYREIGSRYREVHLSEGIGWEEEVEFREGLFKIEGFKYKGGRLYLNKSFWIDLKEEEWAFRIGGCKVIENWLSCREGLELREEEIVELKRLIVRIRKHNEILGQ